jgi:hypothetical protein
VLFRNDVRAAAIVAALSSWPVVAQANATVSIEVDQNLFTIVVTEPSSLDTVLKNLGDAAGAIVEGGDCDRTVGPISLHRVTFDDAIRSLAPEHSLIVERNQTTAKIHRILLIEAVAEAAPPPVNEAAAQDPSLNSAEEAGDADAAHAQAAAIRRVTMSPEDAKRNKQAAALRDIAKLGYSKDRSSADQLEQLARSGDDPTVRAAALSTLAKSANIGSVRYLKSKLLGDPDPQMRLAAAKALFHFDRRQSKTLIGEAIKLERDPELRKQLQVIMDE